ncbi:hypothetical protein [Limnohabitans sp.]|uniref:hypothetical protein n=1 Tax=Limnohabitans sp. TaxID=1907725 RepID=UPI00286F2AAF|nr:hypothetical protein [Limnohabitans sp.]
MMPSSSTSPIDSSRQSSLVDGYAAVSAAFTSALAGERPIAYSVNLAKLTGDAKAALFLSQLVYWTRVGVNIEHHGGWIFKTREQWQGETALSRYEQESARSHLLDAGLMQEARIGSPARNCYRLVPEELGMGLSRLLDTPVQLSLLDLRSRSEHARQQLRTLLGHNLAFYRVFTEITPSLTSAIFLTKALAVQRNIQTAQANKIKSNPSPTLNPSIPWEAEWFHLSPTTWFEETGLTIAQQRDCKQKLCLEGLIETAIQTHPKKRQFLRVDMNKLVQTLEKNLLAKAQRTGTASGLLGVLLNGVNQSTKNIRTECGALSTKNIRTHLGGKVNGVNLARNDVVCENHPSSGSVEQLSTSRQILPTECGASSRQVLPTTPNVGSKELLTSATNCRTECGAPSTTICRAALKSEINERNLVVSDGVCDNHPYSFTETVNPVGGFSQIRKLDLADQLAVNRTDLRMDLADPHARADLTTHNKTTTTTTTPPAVVVVNQDLFWPKDLNAETLSQCQRLIQQVNGDVRKQELIDEMAGNIRLTGKVKSPVAYLRFLIKQDSTLPGGLILEVAHDERLRREAHLAHEQRLLKAQVANNINADVQSSAPLAPPSSAVIAERQKLLALRQAIKGQSFSPISDSSTTQPSTAAWVSDKRSLSVKKPSSNLAQPIIKR